MILVEKLILSYSPEKEVIKNLDLQLEASLIHGIVGLNGSGKTTLLNALYGLKKAENGTILFNGKTLNKRDVSYLVTENFFYSNITGREYLALFKNSSFEIAQWNTLFELPLDEIIDNYSTGMKKKLALLGIIKQNKPVMILDEPFNGLDIESCRIIRSILLKLKTKNRTVIITSHILETLTNLCDKIHYLEKGKIKFSKERSEFDAFETAIFNTIESRIETQINELIK